MRHRIAVAGCPPSCSQAADRSVRPRRQTPGPPSAVTTATVALSDRPEMFQAGGTLHGRSAATVSSRVMATVRAVLVLPGDRVRAGQLLVELDDADVAAAGRQAAAATSAALRGVDRARAEASAAAAAAALARSTHGRIAVLHDRRSATPQELDEASAALASAEARATAALAAVDEAQAGLDRARAGGEGAAVVASYARIVAPFDGVVTEKLVEPGNLVSPGIPLVRVEDTGAFELEVRLDESRAAWVATGARVRILIDGPGSTLDREGRVAEIARAVDVDTRAVVVTIALAGGEGLRPGMFARAQLPGPPTRALVVPESAVVRHGQLTSVFVVEGNIARMRLLRLGWSDGRQAEVSAGLSEGERIVVTPGPALRDGVSVTVRSSSAVPDVPAPTGGRR